MKRRDVLLGIGAVTISQAPMAQLAEAVASNSTQCEFDSHLGYQSEINELKVIIKACRDIQPHLKASYPLFQETLKTVNKTEQYAIDRYIELYEKTYGPFA